MSYLQFPAFIASQNDQKSSCEGFRGSMSMRTQKQSVSPCFRAWIAFNSAVSAILDNDACLTSKIRYVATEQAQIIMLLLLTTRYLTKGSVCQVCRSSFTTYCIIPRSSSKVFFLKGKFVQFLLFPISQFKRSPLNSRI